ncbi:DoxX family protein [Patulibacter sp.]|uniref:DoxX family protein n=1 Tax=Patulibacter sp. TaxID=1912859 RepID=UPI002723F762|nr:DoxX family protein [Patulibacter sp.]MDO9409631.1 DoxX family protein [Patulibacter sp.]
MSSPLVHLAFPRSRTDRPTDVGLLVARLVVGAVFIAHGGQKLFGLWGGGGIDGTGAMFAQSGLTPGEPLAVLAGAGEFFGGILIVLGLMTRLGAFSVGTSMVVAIIALYLPGPLLDGYEFPLTLLVAAVVLLLAGPGRLSLDALVHDRIAGRTSDTAPSSAAASPLSAARTSTADGD